MLSRFNFGWTLVRLKKHWITLFSNLMNGLNLKTMWKYLVFLFSFSIFIGPTTQRHVCLCFLFERVKQDLLKNERTNIEQSHYQKKKRKKEAYLWESKFFAKSISRNHSKFFYCLDNEQGRRIWILESGYF